MDTHFPLRVRYFSPSEFVRNGRNWWDLMDGSLLCGLDLLRADLGMIIDLSPHKHAIGRKAGKDAETQHNIDRWGHVRAVDFFVRGLYTRDAAERVVRLMRQFGFTGIGVYPYWKNGSGRVQVGFHGDTRRNVEIGSPATWGKKTRTGDWVSIQAALQAVPR